MLTGFFLTTINVLPNEFYILKHINIWIFYFAMWYFRWLGFKCTASTCNPFFYESNFCICIRDNFNMANTSVDGKVFECIFIWTKNCCTELARIKFSFFPFFLLFEIYGICILWSRDLNLFITYLHLFFSLSVSFFYILMV